MNSVLTTFELILMALLSTLVVVAKIALRLPLKMPGHSGLFWMTIIIVGAGIISKRGSASLIGITSGLMAGFLGMGDFGALNTFLSYTAIGLSTDLALMFLGNPEKITIAMICASFGHFSKFIIKWLFGIIAGTPIGILSTGLAWSAVGYLFWGALGGLLGAMTLRALRKAGFFAYLLGKR